MTHFSKLEKDIELKRLKPDYLITVFEEYFKKVDTSYPTSFRDILKYRKRFKTFFKRQGEFSKSIKRSSELANKILKNTEKTLTAIEKGENSEKYSKELDKITAEIVKETMFIEEHQFDSKEFHQLILIREDLLYRNKLGSTALSSLIRSDSFDTLTKLFSFSCSFLLAFYIGDYIELHLVNLGIVISKLIPALLFFLTIDRIIKWAEETFLWRRVKYLFNKMKELKLTEEQRNYFLNNFNDA